MLTELFTKLSQHTLPGIDFSEDIDEILDFEQGIVFEVSLHSIDFAAKKGGKKRNCSKGYPCGASCISTTRNCKSPLSGQAKNYATWLANQNSQAIAAPSATSPPSLAKPAGKTPKSSVSPIKLNDAELTSKRADLEARFGKKAVADAEANVKKILSDPDVGVHVRVKLSATLEAILGDRFKTSAELGVQSHSIPYLKDNYQDARNRVEAKVLGYDEKTTKPGDRPIYGYLAGRNMDGIAHKDPGDAYGSITLRLKDDVKDRASFTGADSFKSGVAAKVTEPNAAALVSATRHGYDKDKLPAGYPSFYADKSGDKAQLSTAAKAKNIDDLAAGLASTGNRYVEAQVHGKVTPKDIAEIHFAPKGVVDRPTPAIAQFAKDNKVDLFVDGKKLSSKEIDDLINPPKDKRSQRMKDLDDALAKGDVGKAVDIAEKIHSDAQKIKLNPGERDRILKQLYRDSGFDALPEVRSKADMDALAKGGAVMMVRGLTGTQANKFADDFRTGDYFVGNGIFGNGTYVGHSGWTSKDGKSFKAKSDMFSQQRAWDDVEKHLYIQDDSSGRAATLRMALKDDAVVVTAKTMASDISNLMKQIDAWEANEKKKSASPSAIKDYKDSLDLQNATIVNRFDSGYMTSRDYSIPHKDSKYGSAVIVRVADLPGGKYRVMDKDNNLIKISSSTSDALQSAADYYAKNSSPKKEIEEKAEKAREVFGLIRDDDLGNGVSGRYAVVRGIDAIALTNSYEPKSFMNLLNRGKVIVQDTNLSYKEGKNRGVGA